MGKTKTLKFINYITIDNVRVPMDSLDEKKRREIGIRLSDTAMKAIGYVRVDKTA